jgi:hypothetical protein
MPTIRWGTDSGADTNVTFNGNVALTDVRLIDSGDPDDDLALDWQVHEDDDDTVALYRMNESSWDGTTGEITDETGNGHDGTAVNSANTAAGALDRYADCDGNATAKLGDSADIPWSSTDGSTTIEMWIKPLSTTSNGRHILRTSPGYEWLITKSSSDTFTLGCRRATVGTFSATEDEWQHWCIMESGPGDESGITTVHVNGVLALSDSPGNYNMNDDPLYLGNNPALSSASDAYFDDVRISDILRHAQGSNFTAPVWYAEGSAVIGYTGLSGAVPSSISWDATEGASYGEIHQIWIHESGDWTQVGGDDPTSPIDASGYTLDDDDCIKVVMTPKSDAIQSETPILDWIELDYTPGTSSSSNRVVMMSMF